MNPSAQIREHACKFVQDTLRRTPVIVVGSGASAAHGLPTMEKLADKIVADIDSVNLNSAALDDWAHFKQLLNTHDLESALHASPLHGHDEIVHKIVSSVWSYIAQADSLVFHNVLKDDQSIALTKLFQHLLSGAQRSINVITTNYDLLIEYAAEAAKYFHTSGFSYGYYRRWLDGRMPSLLDQNSRRQEKTIRVLKVHGSIDWFEQPSSGPVALPPQQTPPDLLYPLIVTPGLDKYRRTQFNPFRTIMTQADDALTRAPAFITYGYGFNDDHIQVELLKKAKDSGAPVIALNRTMREPALNTLIKNGPLNFYSFERSQNGTLVRSRDRPEGTELEGLDLWQLENLLIEAT